MDIVTDVIESCQSNLGKGGYLMNNGNPLVEMWNIVNRITLYILDAVPPDALEARLTPRSWNVGQHFAHLHNNRIEWMGQYPDLAAELVKIPKAQATDKPLLQNALGESGAAVARMIAQGAETGRIKGMAGGVHVFVGYMVAHESYHHGEIGVVLGQTGRRLPDEIAWGMWEWAKR
jgi:uncharacterized damage-inducible protein DinB